MKKICFTAALASVFHLLSSGPLNAEVAKGSGNRPMLGLIMASDGQPTQASIDFYRAVYTSLSNHANWDALPMPLIRRSLAQSGGKDLNTGGIPAIDRKAFRSNLPRRSRKAPGGFVPGSPVPELQRFADNTRTSAVIVVDCARQDKTYLKGCGLYYYDRVAAKVIASSVKTFVAGARDVALWATPMLTNLEEGIAAAQREKNQAVIEDLIAREEDDDESDAKALIGLYVRGSRLQLSNDWSQAVSGGGLQLGFLTEGAGAYLDGGIVSWSGDHAVVDSVKQTHYGISMMFRAKALESLLWFLEAGGGLQTTEAKGKLSDDTLTARAIFVQAAPGIGIEISDLFALSINAGWTWSFDSSTSGNGSFKDVQVQDTRQPSLSLRGLIHF